MNDLRTDLCILVEGLVEAGGGRLVIKLSDDISSHRVEALRGLLTDISAALVVESTKQGLSISLPGKAPNDDE